MNRGQHHAMLLMLDREMYRKGSWCGETHLQKGTFLLQSLFDVDSEYEFILYKHGPFSFEVRDALAEMQGDGLLDLVARHPGYGPSYLPGNDADSFLTRFPKTVERLSEPVSFVAEQLGNKGVADLERIATAVFILRQNAKADLQERALELVRLKPHVDYVDAEAATRDVDRMIAATTKI